MDFKDITDCTKLFQTKETCKVMHEQTEKMHEQMHQVVLDRVDTIEVTIESFTTETDKKLSRVHERLDTLIKETNQQTQDLVIVVNEKNQTLERLVNEKNQRLERLVMTLQDRLKNKVIVGLCVILVSFGATLGNFLWQKATKETDNIRWKKIEDSLLIISEQITTHRTVSNLNNDFLEKINQKLKTVEKGVKENGKSKY